jgi:hypothetical protein
LRRQIEAKSGYLFDEKLPGFCFFQLQPQTGARPVGKHVALARLAESIEKHSLNASVIVEELQVTRAGNSATGVHMNTRSAVCRERDLMRVADRGCGEKSSDSLGPGGIGLLHVHAFCR